MIRKRVRKRVTVAGTVQGVFYRDSCRRLAAAEQVSGWVRNRTDGTVEAVFEGEPDRVERMLAWARHGPPGAVVDRLEVTDEPPEDLAGFTIRRR